MDISQKKNELINSLKLIIYTYEKLFISILIPLIPIYAEFIFIKAIYKLNKKIKNLNINLYDNLFYLIEHSKISNILLLSTYFYILIIGLSSFIAYFPLIFLISLIFYQYLKPETLNSLILNISIFIFIILIIIHIYAFISIFFISKYKQNVSQFCQSLYELTNNELFNKCAIDFLNSNIKSRRSGILTTIGIIDYINLHKEAFNNLFKVIETLPDKINIIELK
jgi:hypothetical protein